MVDVALFHQENLTFYLFVGDGVPRPGIRLMTVDTLQLHGFVVDIEVTPSLAELILLGWCIADFHGAEAEVGAAAVEHTSFLILQRGRHHIAERLLCRPQAHTFHRHSGSKHAAFALHLVGVELHRIIANSTCGTDVK